MIEPDAAYAVLSYPSGKDDTFRDIGKRRCRNSMTRNDLSAKGKVGTARAKVMVND